MNEPTELTAPGARMIESGHTMQRMQTQYATAITVQRPRVLANVEHASLVEADLLGEAAYFRWGSGKDQVCGPSIKLANVLLRCWGNCAVEMLPVQDTPDAYVFTAAFIDLESGFTLMRQFRQSKKWTVHGRFDAERKADIRFQIGQSKAARNVAFNALPAWLVDKAVAKAMEGVRQRVLTFITATGEVEARKKYMERLVGLGAVEVNVLAAYNRQAVEALTIENLVAMAGDVRAITDGVERVDTLYPEPKVSESTKPATDSLVDRIKGTAPEDLVPEGAADPKAKEQVKALNELDRLRSTITEGFGKLTKEKQLSFLKSCSLNNIILVNVETDVKALNSYRDALISEQ